MERISAEKLETYLTEYGWHYHSMSDRRWITGWQSERRSYPLTIVLTDSWARFDVKPLLKVDLDWCSWPEALRYILELNHDSQLVKLGLDEFGEVSLSIQLFTHSFTYEAFSDAMGVLGHYADLLHDELSQKLAEIGYQVNLPLEYLT